MGLFYVSVEAKPKPQTSKAFPTRLRRPHLFRLAGKDGGEKGRLVTVGACCGCDSGKHRFFSRCEHTKSPYERFHTRRLLRYAKFVSGFL